MPVYFLIDIQINIFTTYKSHKILSATQFLVQSNALYDENVPLPDTTWHCLAIASSKSGLIVKFSIK